VERVDTIAERERTLGYPAPGSYFAFARLSSIAEDLAPPNASAMVANLVKGHEAVVRVARGVFEIADKAGDQPTADVATQRLQIHEKTAWMLRSLLEERG
jgi:starvation-inducible DNA-binding protein